MKARARTLATSAGIVVFLVVGGWLLSGRGRSPSAATIEAAGALEHGGEPVPVALEGPERVDVEDEVEVAPRAGSARAVLGVPALRGRVIEQGSGEGLEGMVVELVRDGEVLATGTSRGDGRFSFDAPTGDPCVLRLVPSKDLVVERDRLDVDPELLEEEVVFRVRRLPAAPARARLVDSRTGEPVPFLLFQLDDPERVRVRGTVAGPELLETDAEGRFRSQERYLEGELSIRVVELDLNLRKRASLKRIPFDHAPGRPDGSFADVSVAVGPTYRLALELPQGIEVGALEAELGGSAPSRDPFLAGRRRARVRPGDPPWVRFSRPGFFRDPSPPWTLSVMTADGGWRGFATVDSMTGIDPEPVRIRLEATGSLAGAIEGGGTDRVFVSLARAGGESRVYGPFADERYRIDWLDPGTYALTAETAACEARATGVRVSAGEVLELDLDLRPRATAGVLAGVVLGEGGARRENLELYVTAVGREYLSWNPPVVWSGDHGSFRLENLPPGEYVVWLSAGEGTRVEPARLRASPPDETLELTVRDDPVSPLPWAIRAVDAESGARLRGSMLAVRARARGERPVQQSTELPIFAYKGDRFEWSLECEGHERAWGDETSFADAPQEDSGARLLTVALRRGWSGRVSVRTEEGEPLAGVSVAFDGAPALETGPDGRVVQRAPAKPRHLDVHLAGWRIVRGDVDPASGAFADKAFEISVVMVEQR